MNIQNQIQDTINIIEQQAKELVASAAKIAVGGHLLGALTLSETVTINAYGGTFWVEVYNREDLQACMTLAAQWSKQTEGDIIKYSAEVLGISFHLRAHDAALPSTCKLVEEEYVIPAQEARVSKRMVVKCNTPVAETPAEVTA